MVDTSDSPIKTETLLPAVYEELRTLAHSKMAKEANQSLGGTTLVHEAFIRMAQKHGGIPLIWENRAHFFGAASEAMRRVIIDRARKRNALKRGANPIRVDDSLSQLAEDQIDDEVLAVDEALQKLAKEDPESAEIVHLRYFVGLSWDEIASLRNTSKKTAQRHWKYAKSWLRDEIENDLKAVS